MLNKELIFFGCSHSNLNWKKYLNLDDFNIINYSESGASNELILSKVKSWIIENYENCENKILIIQLSYLNRKRVYFEPNNTFLNLHGIGSIGEKIVKEYYCNWIKYFFNYEKEFEKLILELKILKKLLFSKNIKHILFFWEGIDGSEIKMEYNDRIINIDSIIEKKLVSDLDLLTFDDETIFANKWAEKNKLRLCDIRDIDDVHLSDEGNYKLAKIIKNKILKNEISN